MSGWGIVILSVYEVALGHSVGLLDRTVPIERRSRQGKGVIECHERLARNRHQSSNAIIGEGMSALHKNYWTTRIPVPHPNNGFLDEFAVFDPIKCS